MIEEIKKLTEELATNGNGQKRGQHMQIVREDRPISKKARQLDPDRKPWERQPRESEKAFAAFCAYRDAGKDRSITALQRQFGTTVVIWSPEWQWVKRAYEFDLDCDRKAAEAVRREVVQMQVRHARHAQLHLAVLSQPAQALMKRIQREPEFMDKLIAACETTNAQGQAVLDVPKTLEVMDTLRRFAEAFPKVATVERVARGEPGEIVQHDGQVAQTPQAVAREMMQDEETADIAQQLFEKLNRSAAQEKPA